MHRSVESRTSQFPPADLELPAARETSGVVPTFSRSVLEMVACSRRKTRVEQAAWPGRRRPCSAPMATRTSCPPPSAWLMNDHLRCREGRTNAREERAQRWRPCSHGLPLRFLMGDEEARASPRSLEVETCFRHPRAESAERRDLACARNCQKCELGRRRSRHGCAVSISWKRVTPMLLES